MTSNINKPKLAKLCIDIGTGQAIVTKDGKIEFSECSDDLSLEDLRYIVNEADSFLRYKEIRSKLVDIPCVKEEKSMIFERSLNLVWTDGGNSASSGYFEGAGEFNKVLLDMFARDDGTTCYGGSRGTPFYVDVMGHVKMGSKVKCTIRLEVVEEH